MLTHLPHRVSIMTETRTAYQGGTYTTSWVSASIEWANCQISSNKTDREESNMYQKKQQFNKYSIIMRDDISITNKNRIIFNSKILSVESVTNPTNRDRMLQIIAREEVV